MTKGEQRICVVEDEGLLKTVEILDRGERKRTEKALREWILKHGIQGESYLVVTIETHSFGSRMTETKVVCQVSAKKEKEGKKKG